MPITKERQKKISTLFSNEFSFNMENIKITLITVDSSELHTNITRRASLYNPSFMHTHSCYELFYCDCGKMNIVVDNVKVNIMPGQILCVPPKTYHAMKSSDEGTDGGTFMFQISNNGLVTDVDLFSMFKDVLSGKYVILDVTEKMFELVLGIIKAGETRDVFTLGPMFHEFVYLLIKCSGKTSGIYSDSGNDNMNLRLHKISTMLHVGSADITIEQVAEVVGLSTRQVSRIVKDNYNCTFKEIVTRTRMEKAGELLVHSRLSVAEVAGQVGYNSVRSFYTAFKNHYGCLPGDFRDESN